MNADHPSAKLCERMAREGECGACGERDCPGQEPLHYHHDGCPFCIYRPYLVGELNPYQATDVDPFGEYDLYPAPDGSAGERLCRYVLGLQRKDYLNLFNRRNLLRTQRWSVTSARAAARELVVHVRSAPLVLLGAKVAAAFGLPFEPYSTRKWVGHEKEQVIVILPHPSGLSRAWNAPDAVEKARRAVDPLIEKRLCATEKREVVA
jgi:hypothetical protein